MINALPPDILAQVLDTLPVRIFWKDRQSLYLGCNKRFLEDAGVEDPNDLIGKSDYFFFDPDMARAFRDDDAEVMFLGRPKLNIMEKFTRSDGSLRWLETNKWPLRDASGVLVGVLGMYLDITEQKFADDEKCRACLSAFSVT